MLKTLIEKELREHLFTTRMGIAAAVIIGVLIINGLVFNAHYSQATQKYNTLTGESHQGLDTQARAGLNALIFYEQTLVKPPSPLGFVANGQSDLLPNGRQMNHFKESQAQHYKSVNRFFSRFMAMDWTFVLIYILSFVALAFSYSAFSGEKERGTLKLMLSNNLSRGTLILGKFLGLMICVTLPFMLGVLINLLVVLFNGQVMLGSREFMVLLLFFGVSLIFIALNILLGLFISSLTARAAHSLNWLLMIWIFLAVIMPSLSWISARQLVDVQSEKLVNRQFDRDIEELYKNGNYSWSWRSNWEGQPPNDMVRRRAAGIQATDAHRLQFYRGYEDSRFKQTDKAIGMARLSPFSLFRFVGETLSDNGFAGFKRFTSQTRLYHSTLEAFDAEQDRNDASSYHLIWGEEWSTKSFMSQKPVDPDEVPRFEYQPPAVSLLWQTCQWDILILAVWCVLLFAATHAIFIRYDVR